MFWSLLQFKRCGIFIRHQKFCLVVVPALISARASLHSLFLQPIQRLKNSPCPFTVFPRNFSVILGGVYLSTIIATFVDSLFALLGLGYKHVVKEKFWGWLMMAVITINIWAAVWKLCDFLATFYSRLVFLWQQYFFIVVFFFFLSDYEFRDGGSVWRLLKY